MVDYKKILKEELKPAFGCTEPIALAYASAKAREVLGFEPTKIIANLSGNIIKNANSVNVPGTQGRKGIEISIISGAILGDADRELEVLSGIDKSKLDYCENLIKKGILDIKLANNKSNLYIDIEMFYNNSKSKVIMADNHTNIIFISKDEKVLYRKKRENIKDKKIDFSFEDIYKFSKECDYSELKYILDKEIEYNMEVAREGIKNEWGSNIGTLILENSKDLYYEKMAAYAAAGSDARMGGCELPVIINSGSGNQGITTSVPVILYAMDNKIEKDKLYRALIFSNLISIYIKNGIGKLSAYCGVVGASASAIASIAFLKDEDINIIKETISNALVVNSGIICDGAKSSCAMKIASSIRNATLAYIQSKNNQSFECGDGIVKSNLDETIITVSNIAKYGMKQTDEVILNEILNNKDYIKDYIDNKD